MVFPIESTPNYDVNGDYTGDAPVFAPEQQPYSEPCYDVSGDYIGDCPFGTCSGEPLGGPDTCMR